MENSTHQPIFSPPPPRRQLPVAKAIPPPIPPPLPPPIQRRRAEVVRAVVVRKPLLRPHFLPMLLITAGYVPAVFIVGGFMATLVAIDNPYFRPVDAYIPMWIYISAVVLGVIWAALMSLWWWDGRRKKLR